VTFKVSTITDLDRDIDPILHKCSLGFLGHMWRYFKRHRNSNKATVVVCRKGNVVVGWGIKTPFRRGTLIRYNLMLFVTRRHRRKGIGKKMLAILRDDLPLSKIKVYPDGSNLKFFKKVLTDKKRGV